MRTSEQYREGLRKMRRNVYVGGELVDRDDERMMGAVRTLSTTLTWQQTPSTRILLPQHLTSPGRRSTGSAMCTKAWRTFTRSRI